MKNEWFVTLVFVLVFGLTGLYVLNKTDKNLEEFQRFKHVCEFQKGEVIEGNDERICIKYNDDRTVMFVLMREAM